MIALNIQLWSWIIATIIFLAYNIFFNKEEKGGYGVDPMPFARGGASFIIYLMFWIIWLIIFK